MVNTDCVNTMSRRGSAARGRAGGGWEHAPWELHIGSFTSSNHTNGTRTRSAVNKRGPRRAAGAAPCTWLLAVSLGISEMRHHYTKIEEHKYFTLCYEGHTPGNNKVGFTIKKLYKNNIESFIGIHNVSPC
ncbi:hypothetical protein EVAR_31029_1 [Eumeta japonica]|uniref:Uncharacterized protein n=1 Tax=Eumeta variegata TaxID=151549 RepID=A0A4C1VDV0_EUMVA|nr:hypothetical protein EVAR_31029_1 [Eumeta japonica]